MKSPFPHPVTIGFSVIAMVGALAGIYGVFQPRMAGATEPIVGYDIQNSGGGVGQEIINNGPGVGSAVSVTAPAGGSVIGTRIIQNGSGTGLRVIQNGPGVGFQSIVTVGPK